jgi:hypothetical protein
MRFFAFSILACFAISNFPAQAEVDQGLLNLVPAETKVIGGFQIEAGKVSPFGQYLVSRLQIHDSDIQKLADDTGFDPRRDLQEVIFASGAPAQDSEQHPPVVVIARGYFNPVKVKSQILAKGGHSESYRGVDLLTGPKNPNGSIAFLDTTLAVAGNSAMVRSVVANRQSPAVIDSQLEQKVHAVSDVNEAWFASILPGSQLPGRLALQNQDHQINGAAIQSILQSSGGVHFATEGLQISFEALTRSDKDAQALSDVFRFFAGMVQMQRENQPEVASLASALNGMQLTTGGSTLHMSLVLPEKAVEQLLSEAGRPHATEKKAP